MAWDTNYTPADGDKLTKIAWDKYIRDNLSETEPAKATTLGDYYATVTVNSIETRTPAYATVATTESLSLGSGFQNLATVGPRVTVQTGTQALVTIAAACTVSVQNRWHIGVKVSGSSSIAATSKLSIYATDNNTNSGSATFLVTGLTPGPNTFTVMYQRSSGTATFRDRLLFVLPI